MIDGFVTSQGVKIHYVVNSQFDSQKLTLVFVPGIMMPAWIWEKQLDSFSPVYNTVVIEPRSQGDSELASEGHYAFSMAQDIQTVIHALQLQQVVLIGWSLAVAQVVNYAAYFASKELVGLVLVDGIIGAHPGDPFYQPMINFWAEFQKDRTANTEKFIKNMFKQPHEESYFKKLNECALRTPTHTVMTLIYNYILQDFRSLLPGITVPTWIATIKGARLDYMLKMGDMLPNASVTVFESAGHAIFVDKPAEFNSALKAFIEKLPL